MGTWSTVLISGTAVELSCFMYGKINRSLKLIIFVGPHLGMSEALPPRTLLAMMTSRLTRGGQKLFLASQ